MIAITTKSSIRVNANFLVFDFDIKIAPLTRRAS